MPSDDREPVAFELYSRLGRLLGSYATQAEAERMLGCAFNAKYVVGVAANSDRIVLRDREELH